MSNRIFSTSNRYITVGNTGLLILVIILLFVLPIFPVNIYRFLAKILFSFIFISLAFALSRHRKTVFVFAFFALLVEWLSSWFDLKIIEGLSQAMNVVLFDYVVILLIAQLIRSKRVEASTILEAINGYLLAGMAFSLMIAFIHNYDPDAFGFKTNELNFSDYSYFGLVTFSTLGYGDIVPLKPYSKAFATLIALSGQIYLAVIIALLVGKFASTFQNKDDNPIQD